MGGKGSCVDEHLDTTSYAAPVPLIGLYIAAATLVCFLSMTFDLVHGLVQKKPFVPCKLFSMSSFSMTVLAIATKIPVDLTTSMPRAEDQLSKLTGTALLCTSIGFFMPSSLGTAGLSERYNNVAALSVLVITMIVNVCIQMSTGVVFAFQLEHIIIMACALLLLMFMWSSAIAFRGQTERMRLFRSKLSEDKRNAKDLQGLKKLLVRLHVLNYTGNNQTILCEMSHHHVFVLLCAISSAVVLQAMVRLFAKKYMRFCNGAVSDYRWSIPIVIVVQVLTISVGTFTIIRRWFSFLKRIRSEDAYAYQYCYSPQLELDYLKFDTFSFRFSKKKLSRVFLFVKDCVMDVLIYTQMVLYAFTGIFIGLPVSIVKKFLECIIPFDFNSHEAIDNDDDEMYISTTRGFVISFLNDSTFQPWITKMAMKDMMRWNDVYKRVHPTHLVKLISKFPASASKSECDMFLRKLEATGEEFLHGFVETDILRDLFKIKYEYRVSCISVLVLSRILEELMPSSRREFLMHTSEALSKSFETLYYVDQKYSDVLSKLDEARSLSAKDVWAQWQNPNHWFQTKIISPAFKSCSLKKSEESEIMLHQALGFIRNAFQAIEEINSQNFEDLFFSSSVFGESLGEKHMTSTAIEFLIICKFIQEQHYESVEDLFDFLEMCFVKMLCCTLSNLPLAILKEINGDDPFEIGERRVRKAFNFFCELELLGDTIEWTWPANFVLRSRVNYVHSLVQAEPNQTSSTTIVAPDNDSEVKSKASLTVAAAATEEDHDDDTIREIGSDEIV